ncbi:MAG: hypothetical protein IJQ34_05060 [Kiritimatiellae bacterium]|nr:hypothetical protein [Kiritimatiellia bacterium]
MFSSILLAAATFQIGPFYQQKQDYFALRPIVAYEEGETDILWPLFTCHRDWWRFAYIVNYQSYPQDTGYQFSILPIWFNGRDEETGAYAGLFPIYGHHPHFLMMYDLDFALWPLWTHYKMPRGREWLETNSILFPFFSWRSDGAWSFWPVYGVNYQRESDHRYFLWPIVTWASYRQDRDTAGEGYSWMFWPIYGQVSREREQQYMFLPPFFSFAQTWSRPWAERGNSGPEIRIRAPWPFFEYESSLHRERLSVWPIYESSEIRDYKTGELESSVMRFGWKLVEIYDDETRVFPFYASGRDHMRIWPFYESEENVNGFEESRFLALIPIRWIPAVDRNWAKFWTFYESRSCPLYTDHSLFWGIIRWRTDNE